MALGPDDVLADLVGEVAQDIRWSTLVSGPEAAESPMVVSNRTR
ncbi:hypothetical protein [Streptomyces parvulus]